MDQHRADDKGTVLQRLNVAGALYRMKRDDQGVQDPAYPRNPDPSTGSACCFLPQAGITSEGIDLELSGAATPGLQLFAGYTYVRTRYDGEVGDGGWWESGAFSLSVTPRHQFKVWSTWRLPGELWRWTLNTGLVAQSESFTRGSVLDAGEWRPYQFTQGGYALWNAAVQYEINERWSLGLYGDNLTDKTYYQLLGSVDYENVYGTPRNFQLTLKGRW